ncbi:hypothetical protein BJF78_36555 [Pseudonocardia sp. CNS-139]|nr:hypothetical protein BJF78_36555 [Pseudonocardia sp. CNS-139]
MGDGRVLAGPFADQADCYEASPPEGDTWEHVDVIENVYGVRGENGTIEPRISPAEKAFAGFLDQQLSRLSHGLHVARDAHPGAVLAREVATALVEAGFVLHDCAARSPLGGVCLTPNFGYGGRDGVIVTWAQHHRMARDHVRGYDRYVAVQDGMNYAVADVLAELGFAVEPFGQASAHIVTAVPPPGHG